MKDLGLSNLDENAIKIQFETNNAYTTVGAINEGKNLNNHPSIVSSNQQFLINVLTKEPTHYGRSSDGLIVGSNTLVRGGFENIASDSL